MARGYYPRAAVELSLVLEGGDRVESFFVVPRKVQIERNDHRAADTFDVELDYQDLPFDPRAVQAAHVAIALGDVESPDRSVLEDPGRYLQLMGFADEPETELNEGSETVRLRGRDYTGVFLDTRWSGAAVDVTAPLITVARRIVDTIPGMEKVTIETPQGAGPTDLVIADILGKRKFAVKPDDDTWTVLSDLCAVAGLVPVFDLDTLAIRSASEVGRHRASFVYGEDVERLVYRRKYNEIRTMQVKVVCWDEQARLRREALWPRQPILTRTKISADGKTTYDYAPIVPFYVQGSYTPDALIAIARGIYDDLAREQVDGTLETREMTSAGTDLWALANGDKLSVRLGKDLGCFQTMSAAELRRHLRARGLDESAARRLNEASSRADDLASSFYVKRARHSWDRESGYRLSVDFINYVGPGA